jgi:hypothetical protein
MIRSVIAVLFVVVALSPASAALIVTHPTYDQIVGCWVGFGEGGVLFQLASRRLSW